MTFIKKYSRIKLEIQYNKNKIKIIMFIEA
jgi:hypothetical protein